MLQLPVDFTINIPTLVGGIGAIVAIVMWFARLEGRVNANDTAWRQVGDTLQRNHEETGKLIAALEGQIALNREQFHEYKLQSAKEFTTRDVIATLKSDLRDEIGAMEKRLVEQIGRLAK